MLQKKLLARLGLLVFGFISGAIVSIVLLQGILHDLDSVNSNGVVMMEGVQDLGTAITSIEAEMYAAQLGVAMPPGSVPQDRGSLNAILDKIGAHLVMQEPGGEGAASYARIREMLPTLRLRPDAPTVSREMLTGFLALHREVMQLAQIARRHVAGEQVAVSRDLRALIIGLTAAALVMVNITVIVLLRTAGMILRPVGELVEGSRQLGRERFDFRVRVDQEDEFGELARAFNRLADELATNEQRKVEALHHLAVTLNHELNNILGIITLQLSLLDRRSGGDPMLTNHLHQIHENLGRMERTIASLRNVRRVVLTDYMPGEKMLDLPRSVAAEDQGPEQSHQTSSASLP